jgi:hypothetical protein
MAAGTAASLPDFPRDGVTCIENWDQPRPLLFGGDHREPPFSGGVGEKR